MTDPFAGGFDPRMFQQVPLFRELARVMSWTGGPVNWDLARQTAEAIAGEQQPGPGQEAIGEAVRVAELWLDEVTALPSVAGPVRALTPRQWVDLAASSDGLGTYVEPVAGGMGEALGHSLPPELQTMLGGQAPDAGALGQAFGALGALMYGVQVGTIAGHLAGQLLGCYDLGVPTVPPHVIGTVGGALERCADEYAFEETELRYWLALREALYRRMYAGVPWLHAQITDLVGRFATEADFDPEGLMEALGGMGFDPGDPDAVQEALSGPGAFRVEPTSAQRETLARLQAIVTFTEGYVVTVLRTAAGQRLTALPRVEETMQRRRAERGPGERFLQQLIGLDLQPADLRQGQAFCAAVVEARGQEGLDRVWRRPEHLPSPPELAEPSRWLVRMAAAELEDGGPDAV